MYKRYIGKKADAEVAFLADFLRRSTRREDKRYYVVTFADLNTILNRYGCSLQNPHGNRIDVLKAIERRRGPLGLGKKVVEERRLMTVGFPRWTAQVNQKALKGILKATELTPEKEYDSQVLFKDAEPMSALIDTYREPLRRLRDK